jgi:hypothetical protein
MGTSDPNCSTFSLSNNAGMSGVQIGFAPNGEYWHRVASTHLFSPRRVTAHEPGR